MKKTNKRISPEAAQKQDMVRSGVSKQLKKKPKEKGLPKIKHPKKKK